MSMHPAGELLLLYTNYILQSTPTEKFKTKCKENAMESANPWSNSPELIFQVWLSQPG